MERLKSMKETLVGCVQGQLANISEANTEELGQAIDMIKDLEEAMYYCSIVKAMEKQEKENEIMEKMRPKKECHHHYTEMVMPYYPPEMYYPHERDIDRERGKLYYSERQPRNSQGEFTTYERRYYDGGSSNGGNSGRGGNGGGTMNFYEREMPFDLRDSREGRSPISRRHYMESKEMHQGKEKKIKELEKYMQELSEDIVEMIEDASPEEK